MLIRLEEYKMHVSINIEINFLSGLSENVENRKNVTDGRAGLLAHSYTPS